VFGLTSRRRCGPELDHIDETDGEGFAVGGISQGMGGARRRLQGGLLLACGRVPQLDSPPPRRRQCLAVPGERHAEQGACRREEGRACLSSCRVPAIDLPVDRRLPPVPRHRAVACRRGRKSLPWPGACALRSPFSPGRRGVPEIMAVGSSLAALSTVRRYAVDGGRRGFVITRGDRRLLHFSWPGFGAGKSSLQSSSLPAAEETAKDPTND
jgi:hypothetical protein